MNIFNQLRNLFKRRPHFPGQSISYLLLQANEPLADVSSFSYRCNGCAECCRNNRILLTPPDVLSLARRFLLTTSEFLTKYVAANGRELKQANGSCVFLENNRCSVYENRPYVCRVYPLRVHLSQSLEPRYSLAHPEARSTGEFGTAGSVESFLRNENVSPISEWLKRYLGLTPVRSIEKIPAEWNDVDRILLEHCKNTGSEFPHDEAKCLALHLDLIKRSQKDHSA